MAAPPALQTTNISEEQVIIAFHSFLQGALAQAHAERLLDRAILTSAEADIQIQGPAICLFLAALRSEGDPPSISTTLINLNERNCPSSFRNWFRLWAECVPLIKSLSIELRHDLARIICEQEPECQPILIELPIIAQNLRAIAIEISQRRTFQERFGEDLDYAIRYSVQISGDSQRTPACAARFQPPPAYDGPLSPDPAPRPPNAKYSAPLTPPTLPTRFNGSPASARPSSSLDDDPALQVIRETLYASLADVIYSNPTIYRILDAQDSTDGELSRAYFAALCLSILEVSTTLVDRQTGSINVVHMGRGFPSAMRADECPPHLRPLFGPLLSIGYLTQALADEDDQFAIESVNARDPAMAPKEPRLTKMERLRMELERGANWETGTNSTGATRAPQSPKGRVRSAANQINAVALKLCQIPSFREREDALFQVLVPSLSKRLNRGPKNT